MLRRCGWEVKMFFPAPTLSAGGAPSLSRSWAIEWCAELSAIRCVRGPRVRGDLTRGEECPAIVDITGHMDSDVRLESCFLFDQTALLMQHSGECSDWPMIGSMS